jgi:hypothetical protein
MTALAIRKKLITYLADADDKKVKAVYSLFKDDINRKERFELSPAHKKILAERRSRHLSGKDTSSSWKEAHSRIRNKKKS